MLQGHSYLALDAATTSVPADPTYNMYSMNYDRSEPSSRRDSPSTSGSNTPISFGARGQNMFDKVSLPPIGAMFSGSPTDEYDSRRNSLPYPSARAPMPASATQWFQGLNTQLDQRAHSSTPDSPATGSPTFTAGSYSSSSTAPTTVKSSPGTSPFSDKLSLPPANSSREWSAPMTIPVPPSTETPTVSSATSNSPTPQSDSPPAASAAPQRRRGKLPKHVTETLRTWLLSHADHPYPTEEEKKMLCNVTSLTLSQVSNWMINARRRILVPASKQQAALNATTGPYLGLARSSAATDLARANRQSMTIPHSIPAHTIPSPAMDAYSGAYSLPHLSQAGDLHLSARSAYPALSMPQRTGGYTYGAPSVPNYYGTGLNGLAYPAPTLVQSGPGRYYGDHDSTHPYSATTH